MIDGARFYQNPASGGYESSNHTVSHYHTSAGTPVSVPVPASLTLLDIGLPDPGAVAPAAAAPDGATANRP